MRPNTASIRGWRDVFAKRCSPAADREIREVKAREVVDREEPLPGCSLVAIDHPQPREFILGLVQADPTGFFRHLRRTKVISPARDFNCG